MKIKKGSSDVSLFVYWLNVFLFNNRLRQIIRNAGCYDFLDLHR